MKEHDNLFPDIEIIINEASHLFFSTKTYEGKEEPYSIGQACEDVITKYKIDPIDFAVKIIKQTDFLPEDILDRIGSSRGVTWNDFALDVSSMLLADKIRKESQEARTEEDERFKKYNNSY